MEAAAEVSWRSVHDMAVRVGLSAEQSRCVLALDYPADARVVWDRLAGLGVTQESLVGRMGGSP